MSPALEGILSTTVPSVQFSIVNIEVPGKFNIVVLHKGLHDLPSTLPCSLSPNPSGSPDQLLVLVGPQSGMLFPHLLGSSPITHPVTLCLIFFFSDLFIYI